MLRFSSLQGGVIMNPQPIGAALAKWVACIKCNLYGRFGYPLNQKYALILHSGVVYPHGDLKQRSEIGWTTDLRATFPLGHLQRWVWSIGPEYSHFPGAHAQPDLNVVDLSGNVSFVVLGTKRWLFLNAGPGGYHVQGRDSHAGFNTGAGVGFSHSSAVFELTYNYKSTVDRPLLRFSSLQGGVILNPQPIGAALAKWVTLVKCRLFGTGCALRATPPSRIVRPLLAAPEINVTRRLRSELSVVNGRYLKPMLL